MVLAAALVVAGCGSGSGDQETLTTAAPSPPEPSETTETLDPTGEADATPDVAVPVARFVAHGPGESTTFGPACATGIDERGDDMFRITVPTDWTYAGSNGGSGPDQLRFDAPDATVYVDLFRSSDELDAATGFEVTGDAGVEAALGDESVAVQAVELEGRAGFGLVEFAYLGPLPIVGEHAGTVLVTVSGSTPDAESVASVLSTVRAERCAVVQEVSIWGPVVNVQLVPRFEPDPMGKPYPGGPQPVVAPGDSRVNAYSVVQLAYLLPLDEPVASCVAPLIMELAADDRIADTTLISPANDAKQVVAELAAGCS